MQRKFIYNPLYSSYKTISVCVPLENPKEPLPLKISRNLEGMRMGFKGFFLSL